MLTIVKERIRHDKKHNYYTLCRCECGALTEVRKDRVNRVTRSCGCFRITKNTTHGLRYTSEYRIWGLMVHRCSNKNSPAFKYYGALGVRVLWSSFQAFYRDMGPRPTKEHTIDRIDSAGNYCKENCRWATRKTQAQNRKYCNFTIGNVTKTKSEWAQFFEISRSTFYNWRMREQKGK